MLSGRKPQDMRYYTVVIALTFKNIVCMPIDFYTGKWCDGINCWKSFQLGFGSLRSGGEKGFYKQPTV